MGGRHKVHHTTRNALLRALQGLNDEGYSAAYLAKKMGEPGLTAAFSSIMGKRNDVGVKTERKIRVGLGLTPRYLAPSEKARVGLSQRLRAAGLTWSEAAEIALASREGSDG